MTRNIWKRISEDHKPKCLAISGMLLAALLSAEVAYSTTSTITTTETTMKKITPLVDNAGIPLTALDWLQKDSKGRVPLQMPAPKAGCTAAQLAQNRLDWYQLPPAYSLYISLMIANLMGVANATNVTDKIPTFPFKKYDQRKPVALILGFWPEQITEEDKLLGRVLTAQEAATMQTLAEVMSEITEFEVVFENQYKEGIKYLPQTAEKYPYIRVNAFHDLLDIKKSKSPLAVFPILGARFFKGDINENIEKAVAEGGAVDRVYQKKKDYPAWGTSGTSASTKQDGQGVSYVNSSDYVSTYGGGPELFSLTAYMHILSSELSSINGRVSAIENEEAEKYTHFWAFPGYAIGKYHYEKDQTTYMQPSKFPLPGVSAFAYKPLDLMFIEALADPRVPSTRDARESFQVVEPLLKERLEIYRQRLDELLADDRKLVEEAGLKPGEGCRYTKEDWYDEELASQVGLYEAEKLGLVK